MLKTTSKIKLAAKFWNTEFSESLRLISQLVFRFYLDWCPKFDFFHFKEASPTQTEKLNEMSEEGFLRQRSPYELNQMLKSHLSSALKIIISNSEWKKLTSHKKIELSILECVTKSLSDFIFTTKVSQTETERTSIFNC